MVHPLLPMELGPSRPSRPEATMADTITITLPSRPELAATARATTRLLLASTPAAAIETAELIVSEFYTNAVLWARSDDDGVSVSVEYEPGSRSARIEVVDGGPKRNAEPPEDPEQHGRGLMIVESVAKDWGHRLVGGRGHYWAVLAW